MNKDITRFLEDAAEKSLGNMRIISSGNNTEIQGTNVGEAVDVLVAGKPAKLVLLHLSTNADSALALEAIKPIAPLLAHVSAAGVETRPLAWTQQFAKGATEALAKAGVSSIETATGATKLLLGSYAYINEGTHRAYPEAAAIQDLDTKRGEDLLRAIVSRAGERLTTQSLAAAASDIAAQAGRKPVSTSVVARFVGKLTDLELIAAAGATGFCLTEDGKRRIEGKFSKYFKESPSTTPVEVASASQKGGMKLVPLDKDSASGETDQTVKTAIEIETGDDGTESDPRVGDIPIGE